MRRWRTVLSPVATRVGVLAKVAWMLAFAVVLGLSVRADAADHPVNSEADLRTAITSAVDGDTITFNVDVTLTAGSARDPDERHHPRQQQDSRRRQHDTGGSSW